MPERSLHYKQYAPAAFLNIGGAFKNVSTKAVKTFDQNGIGALSYALDSIHVKIQENLIWQVAT